MTQENNMILPYSSTPIYTSYSAVLSREDIIALELMKIWSDQCNSYILPMEILNTYRIMQEGVK